MATTKHSDNKIKFVVFSGSFGSTFKPALKSSE